MAPDAHEDPGLTDADRTAREVERQHQHMIERLAKRGPRSVRDRWVLEQTSGPELDPPVRVEPPEAYAPPSHARKILSRESLSRLQQLLSEVREQNGAVEGIRASVACVLLADDDSAEDLRIRFRRWADDYVMARLAKRSPRDNGDQVAKYHRLYQELVPFLEDVATREGTVNPVFMREVVDYLAFMFFLGTWAGALIFAPSNGLLERRWAVNVPPHDQDYCKNAAAIHSWPAMFDLRCTVEAARRHGVRRSGLEPTEIRSRLRDYAADIREMRPLVIRDHNPDKVFAEFAPGLWATWFWGSSQQLGWLPIHDDERRRTREVRERVFSTTLCLRHDGLVANEFARWITADTILHEQPEALDVNLAIVEALHARLMEVFARVDLAAMYDNVRGDAGGAAGAEAPTQAALLASFTAAESLESPLAPAPILGQARRLRPPTLRMERFLAVLERIGCEVRQGKGSEVVVYRHGGKLARIGRHTRNREVPSALVQRVLHQVGVTLAEWINALR